MGRVSHSWQQPDLRQDAPVSLREQRALRTTFDHVRDPYVSAQLNAAEKTEAQRRGESGRGSLMVKRHRPFPELRPRYEDGPTRAGFNQAWLREQRAARLARFAEERASREQSSTFAKEEPTMAWERER